MTWTQQDIGPEPDQIDIERDLSDHRHHAPGLVIGSDQQRRHLIAYTALCGVKAATGRVEEEDVRLAADLAGCPEQRWRLREQFGWSPEEERPT